VAAGRVETKSAIVLHQPTRSVVLSLSAIFLRIPAAFSFGSLPRADWLAIQVLF